MNKQYSVLAINPGSTSTKIAVYKDRHLVLERKFQHDSATLAKFSRSLMDQAPMRRELLLQGLQEEGFDLATLDAVVGRGGKIPPCKQGGYLVDDAMVAYLRSRPVLDDHASNLGAILGQEIARPLGIPAYIYDGVTVDQMEDIARLAGLPEMKRHSSCHVLNMRAMARKVAEKCKRPLEEMNLIVCHMGGGITATVMVGGRMVDVVGDEEGPYSPERSGGLPVRQLSALILSGRMDQVALARRLRGQGGLAAYLATNNAQEVEHRIQEGDQQARMVYEGMAYQIAKTVVGLAAVVSGKVDGIVLTGALAYSTMLMSWLTQRVSFLGPVHVCPGENEMEALALGCLRVLTGEEEAHSFTPPATADRMYG